MKHFTIDVATGWGGDHDTTMHAFRHVDEEDPIVTWLDGAQNMGKSSMDSDASGVYLEVLGAFSITLV